MGQRVFQCDKGIKRCEWHEKGLLDNIRSIPHPNKEIAPDAMFREIKFRLLSGGRETKQTPTVQPYQLRDGLIKETGENLSIPIIIHMTLPGEIIVLTRE